MEWVLIANMRKKLKFGCLFEMLGGSGDVPLSMACC